MGGAKRHYQHRLADRYRTGSRALAFAVALSTACASTGAVPRPFPVPGSAGDVPRAAAAPDVPLDTYALTQTALSLRGVPYRDGGSDQSGFDCSGFIQYVFARNGLQLPREVKDQYRLGRRIRSSEIAAGDLVFFHTTASRVSHVGIAIDRDQFVHAPSSKGVVRVERLSQSYWARRFIGATRIP